MKIIQSIGVAAVLAGVAAVGLAGSAAADPVAGPYSATMVGGNNNKQVGQTIQWAIAECGPDCIHIVTNSGPGVDLHREGPFWSGVGNDGCRWQLQNDSLALGIQCEGSDFLIQFARI